jgi:class 3 adenylate cyclase/tetratricopeptide (TPR) repeat protein
VATGRRERKIVTVLFADLVGFTSRSEQLDPEDVADELGRYHAHVREELERRGGTVEKFIGDAAMAIFGAPVAHEDDPERAVRAALAIQSWAKDEGIEIRIGINTGEALVTVDARPEAGETMAAGDVVNTAARLQSAAPVSGILVGEQAHRATERAIEYREAPPVEAKGKAEPVVVWEAVQARARAGIERVHGATLVGRAREVALLEDALARTLGERSAQLVTLVGVPGIGKSRLVLELYGAIERLPELISWRHGRCLPYGDGVTFWALGEMVKAHAGILEGDDPAEAERKLSSIVDDPWVESHLRPLVGLGGAVGAGGDAREEAFTAWRRFFEGLADERPLVLVFEDLHWADDHLLDFVDNLVDWASGVPLLVIGTARPELLARRANWGGGKLNSLTVSLSPLSDDDTALLLHELLGSVLPAETQLELLGRAGGNPLYAEEFARMLRDGGGAGGMPETVQGLIAARIDLLEPEQKVLLQDAAVIGKSFWAGAVSNASEIDGGRLELQLHALERKEFVRRERTSTVADETEYAFRHLLVRDVAYSQLPRAQRAEKHLAVARWLEQLGRPDDHAEMLAHHYLHALELTRASGGEIDSFREAAQSALTAAGDRAVALHAYETAVRFFRGAVELLPDAGADGRLLLRLARALFLVGDPDNSVLERATAALLDGRDVEGAVEAETLKCELTWMAGERDVSLQALDRALELAKSLPPTPAKAGVTALASRVMMLSEEHDESVRTGEEALAMATALGLDEIRAATLNNIGSARAATGDLRGLDEIAEAIEVAREANAHFELCRAMGNLAALRWKLGQLRDAYRLWADAGEEARRYGQSGFARWFEGILADKELEFGAWDEGAARADRFLAAVEAGSPHYLAAQCYSCRSALRLARGDPDAAVADVERALELALKAKDSQLVNQTRAISAHVLLEVGRKDEAFALADEFLAAIKSGQSEGFGITRAHTLAWTLVAAGRGEEAAEAFEQHADVPWAVAGAAYARGEYGAAADLSASMGATLHEAYDRLAAARAGDIDQLEPALRFYRSVGATWYLRQGESILAASA